VNSILDAHNCAVPIATVPAVQAPDHGLARHSSVARQPVCAAHACVSHMGRCTALQSFLSKLLKKFSKGPYGLVHGGQHKLHYSGAGCKELTLGLSWSTISGGKSALVEGSSSGLPSSLHCTHEFGN
jgi:hypothetical protein